MNVIQTQLIYLIFNSTILFAMYYRENNVGEKRKIHVDVLILMMFTIFIGFRHIDVGVDTMNYANLFERLGEGHINESDYKWLGLPLITLLRFIIAIVGTNYVIINTIIAFVTIYFIYYGIIKNASKPAFSMYLLMVFCLHYQMMNQSRQLLAIAIVLYSYTYIKECNIKKFVVCIIFATIAHSSSIIFLPFYFITKIKINKKVIIAYIIMALGVFIFSDMIIWVILNTSYGQIYGSTINFEATSLAIINFIIRIVMCILAIIFMKNTLNKKENNILYHLVIWCTLLQIIAVKIAIFARVTTYFYIFYIFLIPEILISIQNVKIRKYLTVGVIIVSVLYYLVYYHKTSVSSGYDIYNLFLTA